MGINELRAIKGLSDLYPRNPAVEREVKVKVPKAPKPVNKRSEKQKDVIKELKKLYPKFLHSHPFCLIKSPECTKISTVVNHIKGRGIDEVLDINTWEPSCAKCNTYIEANDKWARKNGHKIPRIK